jgi:hypothetical protein
MKQNTFKHTSDYVSILPNLQPKLTSATQIYLKSGTLVESQETLVNSRKKCLCQLHADIYMERQTRAARPRMIEYLYLSLHET